MINAEVEMLLDEYIVASYSYAKCETGMSDFEIWYCFIKAFFGQFNEEGFYTWVLANYGSIDVVIGLRSEEFFDLIMETNTPMYSYLRTYKQVWNWIANTYIVSLPMNEVETHVNCIKNMNEEDRMGYVAEIVG